MGKVVPTRETEAKLWAEAKVGAATEAVQKAVDEAQAAAKRVAALPGEALAATKVRPPTPTPSLID